MNKSSSEEFLKSRESIVLKTNLNLTLLLLCFGNVVSNFCRNNYQFDWISCINIAISAVLIIFMGFFRNDKFFYIWANNLQKAKVSARFVFLGIFMIGVGYLTNVFVGDFQIFNLQENPELVLFYSIVTKLGLAIFRMLEYFFISMGFSLMILPFVVRIYRVGEKIE